jgi:hypothetical protein
MDKDEQEELLGLFMNAREISRISSSDITANFHG